MIEWQTQFAAGTIDVLQEVFYQFTIHSKESLINNIRSNLTVSNPEFTQILHVELRDVIPERAILILDTLDAVYSPKQT